MAHSIPVLGCVCMCKRVNFEKLFPIIIQYIFMARGKKEREREGAIEL